MIPNTLKVETFDGSAWLSLVPFRMVDVGIKSVPSIYPMRDFPELNLRTYVTDGKKSGVWFFSLDAACWPIVIGGRHFVGLPYHRATQKHQWLEGQLGFSSQRLSSDDFFRASLRSLGETFHASQGSFEHWVTERYCLYAIRRRSLLRMEVHHAPWPLRTGKIESLDTNLLRPFFGAEMPKDARCHLSTGVDVVTYPGVPL
jgi:uncharacterized protein YqjF (DUF2071 family)